MGSGVKITASHVTVGGDVVGGNKVDTQKFRVPVDETDLTLDFLQKAVQRQQRQHPKDYYPYPWAIVTVVIAAVELAADGNTSVAWICQAMVGERSYMFDYTLEVVGYEVKSELITCAEVVG